MNEGRSPDTNFRREIESALCCLIDAQKPEIRQAVLARLLDIIPFGHHPLAYIENVSDASARAALRENYCALLNDMKLRHDLKSVMKSSGSDIDLEAGAYLISRLGSDISLTPESFRADLDALAAPLRDRLEGSPEDPLERLEIFRHYMFTEIGFRGNTEKYGDPSNSFVTNVLQEKKGIPVSLSVVCLLIAQRVKLPLSGVNLPGHFILKYASGDSSVFIDPFNEGNTLTEQDCFHILIRQGLEPAAGYLARATALTIVKRMYRNLINYHSRSGDAKMEKMLRQHFSILENFQVTS